MLVAADALLGRNRDTLPIGYRVLSLDRETTVAPFTRERVIRTLPGKWAVQGPVFVPDTGGVIVWGTEREDIADEMFGPAPADMTNVLLQRFRAALGDYLQLFVRAVPAPVVQMDTKHFDSTLATVQTAVAHLVQSFASSDQAHQMQVAEMQQQVDTLASGITNLRSLNNAARAIEAMKAIEESLANAFGRQAPVVQMIGAGNMEQVAQMLERQAQTIERIQESIQSERPAKEQLRRGLAVMDSVIARLAGGVDDESGTI